MSQNDLFLSPSATDAPDDPGIDLVGDQPFAEIQFDTTVRNLVEIVERKVKVQVNVVIYEESNLEVMETMVTMEMEFPSGDPVGIILDHVRNLYGDDYQLYHKHNLMKLGDTIGLFVAEDGCVLEARRAKVAEKKRKKVSSSDSDDVDVVGLFGDD